MKTSKPVALALSLLLASTSVLAQGGPGPNPRDDRRAGPAQADKRPGPPGHSKHNAPGKASQAPGHQPGGPHAHPGPGNFHKGDRLPADYRGRQYVVDDWRAHRLTPPPRGHRWVQVGADYVLVAIATGIITSVILDR